MGGGGKILGYMLSASKSENTQQNQMDSLGFNHPRFILYILVDKELQGNGVGKKLMKEYTNNL
jgi:ribosomal protein S18 acetylase RimI-like enzyme